MFLLTVINLISCMIAFSHDIVRYLAIGKFFVRNSHFGDQHELISQLRKARDKLEDIKIKKSVEEYTRVVMTMRAQQKVNAIQEQLLAEKQANALKVTSVNYVSGYVLKALFFFVLFVISIYHRYTPVLVFDEDFDFSPLEGLMSFPTGIHNAISVPTWVFASNMTFHLFSSLVKSQ